MTSSCPGATTPVQTASSQQVTTAISLEPAPAPQSRREKEIKATKNLLKNAQHIVKDTDESFLLKENKPRDYPLFDRNELKFGSVLGVGGFGIVFEVKEIILTLPDLVEIVEVPVVPETHNGNVSSDHTDDCTSSPIRSADEEEEEGVTAAVSTPVRLGNARIIDSEEGNEDRKYKRPYSDASQTTTSTIYTNVGEYGAEPNLGRWNNSHIHNNTGVAVGQQDDDSHYKINNARRHMAENVLRNGEARFAVKRLHRDLTDLERARGMIDLAIEAKYLSVIWHPNIIKMRGIASGPTLSPNFFIIMDRLHETLTEKMEHWINLQGRNQGTVFGIGSRKSQLEKLFQERMTVAYDLAAAFSYLHDRKLVYRDIKQENIGFDTRGDVKVFDFGLCKGLSPSRKTKDVNGREVYGYNLTPRTGSVPYMAPEVAECKPYDCKADVFSFAILLWEMLSLRTAYRGYSRREFLERVVRGKERLSVSRIWPPLTRAMMKEAWDTDAQRRPDMKVVAANLNGDLIAIAEGKNVRDKVHKHSKAQLGRRGHTVVAPGRLNNK